MAGICGWWSIDGGHCLCDVFGLALGVAVLILVGVIALFGLAINGGVSDPVHLAAYGCIAGGLVLGVAVLFGGGLPTAD